MVLNGAPLNALRGAAPLQQPAPRPSFHHHRLDTQADGPIEGCFAAAGARPYDSIKDTREHVNIIDEAGAGPIIGRLLTYIVAERGELLAKRGDAIARHYEAYTADPR